MKKSLFWIFLVVGYLIFGKLTGLYLFCPLHKFFHLYCPGCGVTRMLLSIAKLDFYKAFRYNMLLFILLPFATFLYIEYIYSTHKKKKSLYDKIDIKVWYVLLVILLIYGVLRNIFPILAPIA